VATLRAGTTLADKLSMRSTFITPLNIIQVANLKRLRVGLDTTHFSPRHCCASKHGSNRCRRLPSKKSSYHNGEI
jgi:phosphoenolpyruvate carboxylase